MVDRFRTPETLERRRIGVFLAVAFGVSWATALVIYVTGGLTDSPELVGGISLGYTLMATGYMFGPAIGTVVTRYVTGEGSQQLHLRPNLRAGWPYYAVAWFAPAVLTVLGAALYFAVFPAQFDPTMQGLGAALAGQGVEMDPALLLAIQVASALTVGTAINTLFAFGEEFGWRAYLLPKLLPLGVERAVVLQGVVWGVWHWPATAMGYNYGFDYPGFPWTGMLAFLAFTVGVGTFLAWVTVREGSVWPAAVGHGAVNAIAGVSLAFVAGNPSPLLGPAPIGVIAALPWLVLAAGLLRDASWFLGS